MSPREQVTSPPAYPFSPVVGLEIDGTYAELRDRAPVSRVRLPHRGDAWLITGYHEFKQMMTDSRFGTAALTEEDTPRVAPEPQPADMILFKEAPEHTRLRRLVSLAFTGRRVERLRPYVDKTVDELIDKMIEHGPPLDLIEHFAWPLPVRVICELLGIPYARRHRFQHLTDVIFATTAHNREQVVRARGALYDFLTELIAERRHEPTDDLLGAMVQARDDEDRLSESELLNLAFVILVGGHEGTYNQIGNFTYLLLADRARFEELRGDADMVPSAVEEMLRFVPLEAHGVFARVAKDEIELGDVLIRPGEVVIGVGSSANRDKAVFDDPDRLNLRRPSNGHVTFGHGAHYCLGAPLARLELEIALAALTRRLPTLRLAVPETELSWKTGFRMRGLNSLPVAW